MGREQTNVNDPDSSLYHAMYRDRAVLANVDAMILNEGVELGGLMHRQRHGCDAAEKRNNELREDNREYRRENAALRAEVERLKTELAAAKTPHREGVAACGFDVLDAFDARKSRDPG